MAVAVLPVFLALCAVGSTIANIAPTLQLNDGNKMPLLGLGTSLWGSRIPPEESGLLNAVRVAIDTGYRHIDTAHIYKDEHIIGQVLKDVIDNGVVKREDLFITTKLWNDAHRPDDVEPALRESLKKLNLDYVDLYLIHWPVAYFDNGTVDSVDLVDTWRAMEAVKNKGLTRSIGISNFNEGQIKKILESSVATKPAVLQIEVNPNLTQKKLVKFAQENGIVVTAYSPFGSMPSSKRNKDSPAPKWDDPVLTAIGKKYNKSVAQVVLRYLTQRNLIAIPKSVTPSRIRENIDIFDFQLDPAELQRVDDFNLDRRVVHPEAWKAHPEYPFEK